MRQRGGGVGQMHEDQPADDGVDRHLEAEPGDISHEEVHVVQPRRLGPGPGRRDRRLGGVDADDGTGRTNEAGGEE